ncbi:outer membrane beta-barrel protein [Chitinophaga sp.]|uniref:outer membrane beta-barrel protein n=1 Tax=Chitinophaga sp. TaxID=1869181 RepID=UPI0031D94667
MKKIFFTLGLLGLSYGVFAQDNTAGTLISTKAKSATQHSKDFLVIELGYVGLTGTGAGNLDTKFNRTLNVALMYDIPLTGSNFSLAPGLGIGSDNYIFNNMTLDITNTSAPSRTSTDAYKKSKLATTYLEIPLELRFRQVPENANKGFKAAVGLKAGYLLNAHTRTVGSQSGFKVVEKESSKYWFNTFRFVGTARIGYGNWALFGTYALNGMFKDNSSFAVNAYSFGISVSGL